MMIGYEAAWEKAGFTQYLKTITNANDQAAVTGKMLNGVHNGREAGNGTGAKIVAVGEPAGDDDTIITREICLTVPYMVCGMSEDMVHSIVTVRITPSAGEEDDPKFHGCTCIALLMGLWQLPESVVIIDGSGFR